ncbi:hypothetical protein SAMD00019534_071390 [Acytostelium subglobosum LB1]|uniref:hypothetical protein n=1 Tax=Acytostelium subglobosum LB1 TaxID=1410327 RepID=UPI000644A61E|nr:hypothetical protein SAMD00019534_071390 [Acytostelium subglobosum LB1]GAM23964.1 hypothetical protein SAMD00019534_071390 [Acytostelium subglobosum LB1]|eukprot:XP_012753000.1 hypothetical protein SAMD00019534_071390 [Acytostelium subglobosum LB1]
MMDTSGKTVERKKTSTTSDDKVVKDTQQQQQQTKKQALPVKKPNFIVACILAMRPWSLTAGASCAMVGTALANRFYDIYDPVTFAIVMVGAVSTQVFGNLINSYYDFASGVDQPQDAADRTMFDLGLTQKHVSTLIFMSLISAFVSLCSLVYRMPPDVVVTQLLPLVMFGALLTVAYTAAPFNLKYRGLGDVVIVICFGPLIIQGSFIAQTHFADNFVYLFSIPLALTIEGILHVNNTRDIVSDRRANATTLANIIGHKNSLYFYIMLYVLAYGVQLYLSLQVGSNMINLPFIVVPKLFSTLIPKFKRGEFGDLVEQTAQFSFFFGGLSTVGILYSHLPFYASSSTL